MGHSTARDTHCDSILDALDRLIQRYGYKKTTVEDIAREADVCRATVYLHFKSKEEIALSWIERINRQLYAELERIAATEAPPNARVREMLLKRVLYRFDFAQRHTQSIDDMLAALRSTLLVQRERIHGAEAAILARVLRQGREQGEFAFEDAERAASLILLATNSLLPYSLSVSQLGRRDEIEAKAAALTDLLLDGLRRRSAPQNSPNLAPDTTRS